VTGDSCSKIGLSDSRDEHSQAVLFQCSANEPAGPDGFGGAKEKSAMALADGAFEKVAGSERDAKVGGRKRGEQRARFREAESLGPGTFEVMGIDVAQGPEGLEGEEAVAQPQHVAHEGTRMIDHDLRRTTGAENAMDFLDGAGGIGRMVQDAVGVDDIERLIGEGQAFGVGDAQIGVETVEVETIGGEADGAVGQVDAGEGAGVDFSPFEMIGSHADTDFEDVFAGARGVVGEGVDPGFEGIALAGLGFQLLAEDGAGGVDFAAGFLVPEVVDGVFEGGVGLHKRGIRAGVLRFRGCVGQGHAHDLQGNRIRWVDSKYISTEDPGVGTKHRNTRGVKQKVSGGCQNPEHLCMIGVDFNH